MSNIIDGFFPPRSADDYLCSLVGNVGTDPEMRTGKTGKPFATFALICNDPTVPNTGKRRDGQLYSIVCFNAQAENVIASVKKGMRIAVHGLLTWQESTKGDDTWRYSLAADDVAISLRFATVPTVDRGVVTGVPKTPPPNVPWNRGPSDEEQHAA